MNRIMLLTITFVAILSRRADAIIPYDCQNSRMNISTFSLTDIGACTTPANTVTESVEKEQPIQPNEVEMISIVQCKIHVTRMVSHCGMY